MTATVRPMLGADLEAAATAGAAGMNFIIDGDSQWRRWCQRLAYPLASDPGGAFVAERDGQVIGVAQAIQRESLWVLSFLAVAPGGQGAGAGRELLEAALDYGDPSRGLIVASDHPAALRLYEQSGFVLHRARRAHRPAPTTPTAPAAPAHDWVRPGTDADLPLAAAISREQRGAPHTDEIRFAIGRGAQLLVCADRGFAVAQPGVGVWLLAARDDVAAAALLSRALQVGANVEQPVRWVTAGNDWAAPILRSHGLELVEHGAVCVRGAIGPLTPYLPSAPFA